METWSNVVGGTLSIGAGVGHLRANILHVYFQASLDNLPLAIFSPNSRNLTLHPQAHSEFDDIVISILILMREHLTPKSNQVGGAAGLFNYHPYSTNIEY